MNAKDQRKLCKAGYTILRRHDYPQPHITFKSDINPDSWKRYGDNYPSKAERDRAMKRLLTDDKIEDLLILYLVSVIGIFTSLSVLAYCGVLK